MLESSPMAVLDNATRALRPQGNDAARVRNDADPAADDRIPDFDAPLAPLHAGQKILSYELGPRIGAGGMGKVYQARHTWLGRQVAIKFIAPEIMSEPEAVARFAHEARAVGALDHPHIVRATDAGRVGNTHFLVTEFVEGMDLAQLVKKRGPLRTAEACEMIRQAALGLQHAHDQGLVHRDIKPSNLLVDRHGTVKIVDFGIARLVAGQTTLTGAGQMVGTLDFLAPEQASDARHVTFRSDIYSLGCTLYFLLSGHAPFSGPAYETAASKIKGHLDDTPPRPCGGRLPSGLLACLERMMAKSPSDRPTTPAAVAKALGPYCRGARLAELVAGELPALPAVSKPNLAVSIARKVFAAPLHVAKFAFGRRTKNPTCMPAGPRWSALSPLVWIAGLIFFGFVLIKSEMLPFELIDEFGRPVDPAAAMSQFDFGADFDPHSSPPQRGTPIQNQHSTNTTNPYAPR